MEMLRGQHRADAVIVGGGLTGLLLGAALTDAGMQIAILDGCEGASTHCAGQATLLWPWGIQVSLRVCGLQGVTVEVFPQLNVGGRFSLAQGVSV